SQPPLYYFLGAALTAWVDTADFDDVYQENPHPQFGVIVPDGNVVATLPVEAKADAFPWQGTVLQARLVRSLSILMGLGTVWLTYLLGRELFPDRTAIAVAGAALVAFTPMFVFISAVINNDNLSTLLATLLLLLIVRLLKRETPPGYTQYVVLGLAAGAGMLAKFQIGFLLPLIALALLIISIRERDWRPVVIGGAISGGLTILIAGWWYWRNYDLYGDATGINIFLDIVGRRDTPADLRQLWTERETFMMSYWGFFGGLNVPLPDWHYTVLNGVTLVGVAGLLLPVGRWLWRTGQRLWELRRYSRRMIRFYLRHRQRLERLRRLLRGIAGTAPKPEPDGGLFLARVMTIIWPLVVFLSLLTWTQQTWATQGRLLFSAIAPLSLWLAYGLANWARNSHRVRWVSLGLFVAVFVTLATLAPFMAIRPAYQLDRDANWPRAEALETGEMFTIWFAEPGEDTPALEMTFRRITGTIQPGDTVKFAPHIEVLAPMTRNWSLFVHLVDTDNSRQAQRDVFPGGGLVVTSEVEVGESWNNRIAVPVDPTIYAPQTLNVYFGMFEMLPGGIAGDRMTILNADAPDNRIRLGQLELEPRAFERNFGDQLRLTGYDVSARRLAPGEETTLTLRWEAASEMDTDYVISVQVLKPGDDHQIAQNDSPPEPLTSTWETGQTYTHTVTLAVEPGALPDRYRVMVRVYPAGEPGSPLRLVYGTGGQSESFVWLNWIQVR
ncbi:MAG: DUF2142 domain-containing protein, partial [Chloroflexi bacterium]|nr:DUF2142 domain-containing protein [Chloroflexota bacterium]